MKNPNTIFFIFKAIESTSYDRAKVVINKLFSLFRKENKNNIIFIFSFADDFKEFCDFDGSSFFLGILSLNKFKAPKFFLEEIY